MARGIARTLAEPAFWQGWHGRALVCAIAILLYGNTLLNGYCVDDRLIIEGHPQAQQGFAGIKEILTTNYLEENGQKGSYRVLPRLSFAVGYGLWGSSPAIEHGVNILLYAATGMALISLLMLIVGDTGTFMVPLTVALFMAHPLHVEVVASLKSRDELLQFLFAIISARRFLGARSSGDYCLAGGLFLLALMCKESAFQFIVVFPLLVLFKGGTWRNAMNSASVALLAALTYLGIVVAVFGSQSIFWMTLAVKGFPFVEHPLLFVTDVSIRIGTALYGLGYYLRLLVWPYPQSFFYGYGIIPLVPVTSVWALASAVFHLGLLLAGIRLYVRRNSLGLGILLYLVLLAMFSNLLIRMSGIVAERFIYSASLGFCLAVAYGIARLPGRWMMICSAVLLIGLGGRTIVRNRAWHDHMTLATKDRDSYPDGGLIRFYRALHIQNHVLDTVRPSLRRHWVNESLSDYRALIRIWPPTETAYINMARLYENELNLPDSALWAYAQLAQHIRIDTIGSIQLDMARLNGKMGNWQNAVDRCRAAVRLMPDDVMAHGRLAEAMLLAGMSDRLTDYLDTVEMRFPQADIAPIFRGNLALGKGDEKEAATQFAIAVNRYADNRPLVEFLIGYHERNGNMAESDRYRKLMESLQ